MNGRLKIIEQQILGTDGAEFQNLCDAYLNYKENDISSFGRIGTKLGKRKVVFGTPDTYYRLGNGNLSFVEYTTQADDLIGKIKSDIDKATDPKITGIPTSEIDRILVCCNAIKIKPEDEALIVKYAQDKGVKIYLYDAGKLAIDIYLKYPLLAKDILGVPIDTGQILPIDDFVREYNNKGNNLSTPLDNKFLFREAEVYQIVNMLNEKDILLISGVPGVGKTKIAIESLRRFIESNPDYTPFIISKKDVDISEDLRIKLEIDKNYVLLVDDANRQIINLRQLLGIYKENRKGKIKILCTVRNYALDDIKLDCLDYNYNEILLNKFTDDEIKGIIASDPFNITDRPRQDIIFGLADGNARIAIMVAKLFSESTESFNIDSIFKLYDLYFKTYIKDFSIFDSAKLLKTLGLISFFYTIDLNDTQFLNKLLELFKIDVYDFNETIAELEKRELVEIQFDHVKVSEQVMATYFFYLVFIKEQILSFEILLLNYFPEGSKRFNDSIVPANNTFGYENFAPKISKALDAYLSINKNDENKLIPFFNIFWIYKSDEVLGYFNNVISSYPESENPNYIIDTESKFQHPTGEVISLLSKFSNHNNEYFTISIELLFEYIRKMPGKFDPLVRSLQSLVTFDSEHERNDFIKQSTLLEVLLKHHKKSEIHYSLALLALSENLLGHRFHITEGGRGNTYRMYFYQLPLTETIKQIRTKVWEFMFEMYETNPVEVLDEIFKYQNRNNTEISKEILKFDMELLLPFLVGKLDPKFFPHAFKTNELIDWVKQKKVSEIDLTDIKEKFTTDEIKYFKKLDWSYRRGKRDYEFENYDEYKRLKEADLRKGFVFRDDSEFNDLITAIKNIESLNENMWGTDISISIILHENFINNSELGIKLLERVLYSINHISHNSVLSVFKEILAISPEWALRLWKLLESLDGNKAVFLRLFFFDLLPDNYVNAFYENELINLIKSLEGTWYVNIDKYEKFIRSDNRILSNLLEIVVDKNKNSNCRLIIDQNFFTSFSGKYIEDSELLLTAYLQQERNGNHFDFDRSGLKKLVLLDKKIITQYVHELLKDKSNFSNFSDENFSFVWELDNMEELIQESINLITEHPMLFLRNKHPISAFFNHVKPDKSEKALEFARQYINENFKDANKINAIFNVIRHSMEGEYERLVIEYLSLNPDLDDFKKITWFDTIRIHSGRFNTGDLNTRDWEKIQGFTDKVENQLSMIPIRSYINDEIRGEKSYAETEEKMKFTDPFLRNL